MTTITTPPPNAPSTRTEARTAGEEMARVGLIGLLFVQVAIGYEWLISGLTKVIDGGFPQGLAGELRDSSTAAPTFYKSFLDDVVIPHGQVFGYLVEIGELVGGIALIAAALVWLTRWDHLPLGWQQTVLAVTAIASVVGIFMNINFHLANGGTHPWLIPPSGFDEGVDLDSLMPAIQVVLVAVSITGLRILRRTGGDHA